MRFRRRRGKEPGRGDEKRHEEVAKDRLRQVLDRDYTAVDEDPSEVEARLRNLNYGTSRK